MTLGYEEKLNELLAMIRETDSENRIGILIARLSLRERRTVLHKIASYVG